MPFLGIRICGSNQYPYGIREGALIFMEAAEVEEPILRKQLNYIRNIQKFSVTLSNIVGAQVEVNSIADMTRAFEMDINKMMGKTIMIWNK